MGVDVINKYPKLTFPNGSLELKTSWKVLSAAEIRSKLSYTIKCYVQKPGDPSAHC